MHEARVNFEGPFAIAALPLSLKPLQPMEEPVCRKLGSVSRAVYRAALPLLPHPASVSDRWRCYVIRGCL